MPARFGLVGKKSSWPHLGPSEAIFSMDRKNSKTCTKFAYFPWWANGPYSPGVQCLAWPDALVQVERQAFCNLWCLGGPRPSHFEATLHPSRKLFEMAANGGRDVLFPANPDLADTLGRTDFNFEIFFYVLDPKFLDFQVPRSPNFWISRSPDLQIPRFPGPQISRRRRRRTNSQIPT